MSAGTAPGLEEVAAGFGRNRRQHHFPTVARRQRGKGKDVLHLGRFRLCSAWAQPGWTVGRRLVGPPSAGERRSVGRIPLFGYACWRPRQRVYGTPINTL